MTTTVLAILTKHRANLSAATTFEEYRAAALAYVDLLIERETANIRRNQATEKYINEAVAFIEAKWEAKKPTE